MDAARFHEYTDDMSEGLTIDEIDRPTIGRSDGVIVEVGGAG